MDNNVLLTTFVVIIFINDLYGATGGSKNFKAGFGYTESSSQTEAFNMSMRKTPGLDMPSHVLEGFLHNLDANKTVYRYSEIQEHVQNLKKDKKIMRRALHVLPAIMDSLVTHGFNISKSNSSAGAENTTSNGVTTNASIVTRTYEKLHYWSRDPAFDIRTTRVRPRVARRKHSSLSKKHSLRQLREMERNLYRISGINRVGRYSEVIQRAEDNGRRDLPVMALKYEGFRRKRVHIHGPKHRPKERPRHDGSSNEHDFRKSPMLSNAIVPKNISGNNINTTNSNITKLRAGEEKPPDKSEVIELSPYSLLKQINEDLIPRLEKMGANITTEVLGRTLEYNDIVMIKASFSDDSQKFRADNKDVFDDVVPDKRIILIVHGLSVMGFNSVPCLKTINDLLTLISFYYKHLEQFDIYLIPMANPDGVAAANRKSFWNKNMSPQAACPGVALDRNFDVAWNETLCEVSSCSQQFPGTEPFSELETQAVREVFHKYSHKIFGYIHVHSSTFSTDSFKGDAVLYPKGYSDSTSDDDKYVDMKGEIDEMMKNASFKVYSINVDSLYTWYGKVAGTSVDFASTVYGVPFAMEFAMQLYSDDEMVDATQERETATVLKEVWGKIIPVIFDFMFKTLKNGEKE